MIIHDMADVVGHEDKVNATKAKLSDLQGEIHQLSHPSSRFFDLGTAA